MDGAQSPSRSGRTLRSRLSTWLVQNSKDEGCRVEIDAPDGAIEIKARRTHGLCALMVDLASGAKDRDRALGMVTYRPAAMDAPLLGWDIRPRRGLTTPRRCETLASMAGNVGHHPVARGEWSPRKGKMRRHGSESFVVPDEGDLGEALGGREAAALAQVPPFRFSRMGPRGRDRQLSETRLKKLGNVMAAVNNRPSQVPAGFTYLGQFIDHDLTFDQTGKPFGKKVSPTQLVQGRSPTLDLDSLYGAGPVDSPELYESDGIHLKMGRTVAAGQDGAKDGFDLARGAGSSAAQKRKAIIADERNDENLAVAQTHLAFIRFHNRVVDSLPASVPQSKRFARARRSVTKHYQWMIKTDYLPRICAPAAVNSVFNGGRKAFEVGAPATQMPTMPIEFSVAAFRLGHSMIRDSYNWNRRFDNGEGTLDLLFEFSGLSGTLFGNQRLPSNWIADFRRLYDFGEANKQNLEVPRAKFNFAMRIDTKLVNALKFLPNLSGADANLAIRNLLRARQVRLATGQQMARFLKNKGVALTQLQKKQIRDGKGGAELDGLTQQQREAVLRDTPLWFYILREAEFNAGRLKGVGARIVAETCHRAMEGSQSSIVRDADWRPQFGPNSKTFRMVDLLLFAFEGKKSLLAPLG